MEQNRTEDQNGGISIVFDWLRKDELERFVMGSQPIQAFLYSEGVIPFFFLKIQAKWLWLEKPHL